MTCRKTENENRGVNRELVASVLSAAAYRPAKRTLYLRFHSGERYRYFNFPPQNYRDFLAANSKGQYFSRNIRNRFPQRAPYSPP